MGTYMASDELGFGHTHRRGALTWYFAKRWLEKPSPKDKQLIAWLLEVALGRNVMHFIERTDEYIRRWVGGGEIVPVGAFNGFMITGDPVEDTIIPHAVLVWTYMNDRPWPEEVYHDWLDKLLAANSKEAAYLAASLWPAHDLMAKVTYRPPGWLVYRGQLDAEAERLILTEMLKGDYGPITSLYGSFKYDDLIYPRRLAEYYIDRHGFTHPICGLFKPARLYYNAKLKGPIKEALAAPSWSEGVQGAAMLLYLSLKTSHRLMGDEMKILNILEENLFKFDERHINIINFHMDKIEKIDYDLIKDYINHLIVLSDLKMFEKYISIGLRTKDIIYISNNIKHMICILMQKEKEKLESWLEKQADDSRIKDILLLNYISIYIYGYYSIIKGELEDEQVEKKIEDIYGKINCSDKVRLLVDQARMRFSNNYEHKICDFIYGILKRQTKINFKSKFIKDYERIIRLWHPNRRNSDELEEYTFLKSNHVGLYLYHEILSDYRTKVNFKDYISGETERKAYSAIKGKITENLYTKTMSAHLNKIENNNFPYEEIKDEFIKDLIYNINNNNYEISEFFKDLDRIKQFKEIILSKFRIYITQ